MEEARTTIPPPEILESNIMCVIRYCLSIDFAIELKKACRSDNDNSLLPCPLSKAMSQKVGPSQKQVSQVIAGFPTHIKKGCLSDVPGVVLHRMNPKTGKIYCCRGTPSNKNNNLYLDELTGKHVGVGRAHMLISTYLEISNDQKPIQFHSLFCHQLSSSKLCQILSAASKEELGASLVVIKRVLTNKGNASGIRATGNGAASATNTRNFILMVPKWVFYVHFHLIQHRASTYFGTPEGLLLPHNL
jgi:hypothetical protein